MRIQKILLITGMILFCLTGQGQELLKVLQSHPVLAWGGSDVITYNDTSFLVGVAAVEVGTKTIASLRRVGMVKAQKEVVTFISGAEITSSESMLTTETVVDTNGHRTLIVNDTYREQIREDSHGFVKTLQPLGFWYEEDQSVFYYAIYKPLKP